MEDKVPTRRTLYSSQLSPSASRSFSRRKKKKSVELSHHSGLDKEALSLLSDQHETIKQIKGDIKRKEQVISELHEHVDDLLKYKEENLKMGQEIKRMRELLENKEEDNRRYERHVENLEDEKVQNEEEFESMKRRLLREKDELTRKVHNLNKKLSDLVDHTEESKIANRQLENQVETLRHEISRARSLQEKTEADNAEFVEELNQQIQLLSDREREFKRQIDEHRDDMASMKVSDQEKNKTIEILHEQRGEWENQKREQKSFIQSLQKNLSTIQKKVGSLRNEAEKVPTLERELERIPVLRKEYEKAKEEMNNISEILDSQKYSNEQLVEENQRLINRGEEMEITARRMKQKFDDQKTESKESETRYRREIDSLQVKLQNLQDEYDHYYKGSEKEKKERINDIQQLDHFFSTLKSKIDNVVGGEEDELDDGELSGETLEYEGEVGRKRKSFLHDSGLSLTRVPSLNSLDLESFTPVLNQFQKKLKLSLQEVETLRRNNRRLHEESEEQERRISEKIRESSRILKEQQGIIGKFEKDKKDVLEEADRIHQRNQGLEENLRQRSRAIGNAVQQLEDIFGGYDDLISDVGDDEDDEDEDEDDELGGEIDEDLKIEKRRKRRSKMMIGDWDTMQRKLKDTVYTVVVGVNDLRKKLDVVKDQQQEHKKEMQLEMNTNRMKYKSKIDQLREENTTKMREMELTHRKETNQLIGDLDEQEKKYRSRIKEYQESLEENNMKNHKLTELKDILKKSVEDGEKKISQLSKVIHIISRSVRPYVQTQNALKTKLKILALQLSVTEDLASQLVQFFRGLHTEFSSSSFLWKTSKSPMSTSVFSGHRLIRSLEQLSHQLKHIQRRVSREEYEHQFMKDSKKDLSTNILDVDIGGEDEESTNESVFMDGLNLLNEDEVSSVVDSSEGIDRILGAAVAFSSKRLDSIETFVRIMRLIDPKLCDKNETPFSVVTQQLQLEEKNHQRKLGRGRRKRRRRIKRDEDDDLDDLDDDEEEGEEGEAKEGEDPVIKQCQRTCRDILAQFQKVSGDLAQASQRTQELGEEAQRLERRKDALEREGKKKQSLIKVMDEQIKRLEDTSSGKVSPTKVRNLQEAVHQLRTENRALSEEADMARASQKRMKKELRSKSRRLEGARKSLDNTQKSFSEVLKKARDMDDEIQELKQDRSKFKFMVGELNDKYVMDDNSRYIDDSESDFDMGERKSDESESATKDERGTKSFRRGRAQQQQQQQRKKKKKKKTRFLDDDDDEDDDDDDIDRDLEDEIDLGQSDVKKQKKARSAIKKSVTFSPMVQHGRKQASMRRKQQQQQQPRRKKRSTYVVEDDEDDLDDGYHRSSRRHHRTSRRTKKFDVDHHGDSTSLTPLLDDLNQSQELVKQLSSANTKAKREMEDLDREIKRARTSMRELQQSTEFASPKKSRLLRRSYL